MSNFTRRIKKEKEIMRKKRALEIMIDENLIFKYDNEYLIEVYFTKSKKGYDEYTVHLKTNNVNIIKYYTTTY